MKFRLKRYGTKVASESELLQSRARVQTGRVLCNETKRGSGYEKKVNCEKLTCVETKRG